MKHKAENYLGWYGVLAILLAYLMVNVNLLSVHSLGYQLLNLTGAIGIIAEALSKKDVQPAVLNVIWGAIAIFAIVRLVIK